MGYQVNPKRAVQFRQWATRVLREHLIQGWTLNRRRFEKNARELAATTELVRKTSERVDRLAIYNQKARAGNVRPGP